MAINKGVLIIERQILAKIVTVDDLIIENDWMEGNTRIILCSNECKDKTQEDKNRAIHRSEVIAANYIAAGKYKPREEESGA